MTRSSFITLVDNILIFIWGIFLIAFPFFMSTATSDTYTLPKEVALAGLVLLSLLLLAVKMVVGEKVSMRRTPFDVPIALFLLALVLSSLFAVDRADSIMATVPLLLAGLGYFILSNLLKKQQAMLFVVFALLIGAGAASVLSIFSYFKVYPILFPFTHIQTFTPFGSLLEQAFYFGFLLPVVVSFAMPLFKGKTNNKTVTFSILSIIIAAGLGVTLVELFTIAKPVILPFEVGFQTAFAAISQDTGRIAQGFLFGSGYGNFSTVFTRFKQASFNTNPLWSNQFTSSSSFILEILATTGILGTLSFLFLLYRVVVKPTAKRANPVFLGLALLVVVSFVLPFSFIEVTTLFVLLALFAAVESVHNTKHYYDVELKFVALKKGIISLQQISVPSHEKHEYNRPTAIVVALFFGLMIALIGWYGGTFVVSDIIFQKSLVLAAGNNGTATYKDQAQAITIFPYRSVYYRIFSQTNIALASSLAAAQPKGSTPNTQIQNTLYALIQQGITTGKTATTLSPQMVGNWQNLSSVYRSLIGLGQNADSFAILASQQAVTLDPTNPQEYLALGGIYYQLGQWDNAISQFQQAITLKQDYANAYYNLGHSYEQKGDYQNAMTAYQTVKTLVASDPTNLATITSDIQNLQNKMGNASSGQATTPPAQKPVAAPTQGPLNLSGQTSPTQGK